MSRPADDRRVTAIPRVLYVIYPAEFGKDLVLQPCGCGFGQPDMKEDLFLVGWNCHGVDIVTGNHAARPIPFPVLGLRDYGSLFHVADPDPIASSKRISGIRRLRPKYSVGVIEASRAGSGAGRPAADTKGGVTPHGAGAAVPAL